MIIYLINLDRRPDRLAYCTAQAEQHGFTFERLAAIDGQSEEFRRAHPECPVKVTTDEPMRYGEWACLKSHQMAWRKLLESDDVYAVVMEDDFLLASAFTDLLAPDWIPEDADLVKLETWRGIVQVDRRPAARVGSRTVHRLNSTHLGAGAYILSRQAAAHLLKQKDILAADHLLFGTTSPLFGHLRTYQVIPAPVVQPVRNGPLEGDQSWQQSNLKIEREEASRAKGNDLAPQEKKLVPRLQRRFSKTVQAARIVARGSDLS